MVRALLIGHGKMGQMVESLAPEFLVDIGPIIEINDTLNQKALERVDVAIDFSSPNHILDRIKFLSSHKVPLVIGTTGWDQDLEEAKRIIQQNGSACIAAPNFSFGVAIFSKLTRFAAQLFSKFDHYDVAIREEHHRQKKDHPSGTAKNLAKIVLQEMPRKKATVTNLSDGAIAPDLLQVASIRSGFNPGEHSIIFDGPDDTISLTHAARNRQDFAKGALHAARWIVGKKGFFTMEDMI